MENEEYETIDLLEVLNAVRQHLLAVILTTLILACAGFGVSKFLMTPVSYTHLTLPTIYSV